jgi:capsular polysaccharide biosynthesis protein
MSPSFYSSPESERRGSGPRRRRIGNEDQLARLLNRWWSFTVVEFFQLSPREAVTRMSSCSVFFAQRGAALMNLLFMPPGATVIEVLPQEFSSNKGHADLYRRACGHLGLRYMRITQKSQFARVAPPSSRSRLGKTQDCAESSMVGWFEALTANPLSRHQRRAWLRRTGG